MVVVKLMLKTALADGVPANVAVPFPLLVNTKPAGKVPVSVRFGAGNPTDVTVTELAVPTRSVAELALPIAGAWLYALRGSV